MNKFLLSLVIIFVCVASGQAARKSRTKARSKTSVFSGSNLLPCTQDNGQYQPCLKLCTKMLPQMIQEKCFEWCTYCYCYHHKHLDCNAAQFMKSKV